MGRGLSRSPKSIMVRSMSGSNTLMVCPQATTRGCQKSGILFWWPSGQSQGKSQSLVTNSVSRSEEAKMPPNTPFQPWNISSLWRKCHPKDDLGPSFLLSLMKSCVWALYMPRIAINNSSVIINGKTMMWAWMTFRVLCWNETLWFLIHIWNRE